VRIGRSPFANLRLREPFVSEWQAVVRFHGDRTTYLDLGSRNPTQVQGKPIERNVEVEVDASTDVRIGPLRLRFERISAPREQLDAVPKEDTSFVPHQLLSKDRPTGTLVIESAGDLAHVAAKSPAKLGAPGLLGSHTQLGMLPNARNGATRTPSPPAMPLAGTAAAPGAAHARAAPRPGPGHSADTLIGAAREYESARAAWLSAVKVAVDTGPSATTAERIRSIVARHPELAGEAPFRHWALAAGVDPVELGFVDLEHWLSRLCGMPLSARTQAQLALTMEHVGQLLELFASAFIESRRAHQRARTRLGLEHGPALSSVLQQSEDPHAVLAYLLEPPTSASSRSHELRRSLADFAMHQIALLSAVVEGARSMLTQLSPQVLDAGPSSLDDAAALETQHAFADVWPFTARKLWRRFLVRHHDLVQTDHFARELFGREFTRRYHAIADTPSPTERGDRT